jgi:hypothetical protein
MDSSILDSLWGSVNQIGRVHGCRENPHTFSENLFNLSSIPVNRALAERQDGNDTYPRNPYHRLFISASHLPK